MTPESPKVSLKVPKTAQVIKAVGWVTLLEVLRDKVLYNIILCAALLFGIGILASKLTFIHPERVILDFGLSGVILSCCAIAVFTGSGLLGKEFDRRTIHVALSHPISRFQFILGKFLGLVGVLALNWVLLSTTYLVILGFSSEAWNDSYSGILFIALILALLESLMIGSIAIFFSTFSTTSLAIIFSLGLYLVGNTISQLNLLADHTVSQSASLCLKILALVLPNFEFFNFGTKVVYGLPIAWLSACLGILYGLFMIMFYLMLSGISIKGREV